MEYNLRISNSAQPAFTRLQRFYKRNGHKGKIQPNDICAWLSSDAAIVAAVRLSPSPQADEDYFQLKGLWVAKELRGKGIGGILLQEINQFILRTHKPCFCLAYKHLEHFYNAHQYHAVTKTQAPSFLWQRLQRYQNRGNQLQILQLLPELTST